MQNNREKGDSSEIIRNLWVRTKKDGTKQYVLPIGQSVCLKKNADGSNDVIQVFQIIGQKRFNHFLQLEDFEKFYTELKSDEIKS